MLGTAPHRTARHRTAPHPNEYRRTRQLLTTARKSYRYFSIRYQLPGTVEINASHHSAREVRTSLDSPHFFEEENRGSTSCRDISLHFLHDAVALVITQTTVVRIIPYICLRVPHTQRALSLSNFGRKTMTVVFDDREKNDRRNGAQGRVPH